ncbi:MAG: YggU family protein [Woeseiaceae bacterium]|nr:YggU family protein [Woeseiaceae bacterium]
MLSVRVQPRASRDEILSVVNGALRLRTTAAPTDGKANKAVIRLLADYFKVPPSRIRLSHGQTHRNKRFIIAGPVSVPSNLRVAARASNSL